MYSNFGFLIYASYITINNKNTRKIYGQTISNIEAIAVLTDKTPYWHVSNGRQIANTT